MYLWLFGLPADYINGTLRVTFGEENTKEDVDFLLDNLCGIVAELRGSNFRPIGQKSK